jgi:hypothetical protein
MTKLGRRHRSFCCRRSESSRQSTIFPATISRRHNRIRVLHLRRRLPILSCVVVERQSSACELPGNSLASTALYTSCDLSVVSSFNTVRSEPGRISSNLEENIHSSLNEFRHAMISNETFGMQSIMGHRRNRSPQTTSTDLGPDRG